MERYLVRAITLAVPAVTAFCAFYPYRKRALDAMKLRSGVLREICMAMFVAGIAGIIALTVRPVIDKVDWENQNNDLWGDIILRIGRHTWTEQTNFVPILPLFQSDNWSLSHMLINILGNIAMFAPVGFLVSALFRKPGFKRALLTGFALSLFIEVSQYFTLRVTDINDLILNTLGSVCGYGIYVIVCKLWPNFAGKLFCHKL